MDLVKMRDARDVAADHTPLVQLPPLRSGLAGSAN